MRLIAVAVTAFVLVTALPAESGTSQMTKLARRVSKLERTTKTVTKLALLQSQQIEDLKTRQGQIVVRPKQELVGTNYDTGAASGEVRCGVAQVATGGGATFSHPQNGDHLVFSEPVVENGKPVGWRAAGLKVSSNTIDNLIIDVLCVDEAL